MSEEKGLTIEEQYLFDSIIAARKVQEFLWGFVNSEWGLEEWRRMFRKRLQKIDNIDIKNTHWKVELKKRLLQNTALGIALLALLDSKEFAEGVHPSVPSNLPQYAEDMVKWDRERVAEMLYKKTGHYEFGWSGVKYSQPLIAEIYYKQADQLKEILGGE